MNIIKQKDYLEIDIPYSEINEYIDLIEILQFKQALNSIKISKNDAEKLINEINEDTRKWVKEWLKGKNIEISD